MNFEQKSYMAKFRITKPLSYGGKESRIKDICFFISGLNKVGIESDIVAKIEADSRFAKVIETYPYSNVEYTSLVHNKREEKRRQEASRFGLAYIPSNLKGRVLGEVSEVGC